MASRYWVAFSSTNWNDSFNWASTSGGLGGASVPSSSDDVFFDGNGTGSCSLDVNASVISITIDAGYTGTLDAVTFDLTTSGNFTDNAGRILFGSGTWNIGGNLTLRGTSNTDCQSATINVTGNTPFNQGAYGWIPGTSVWTVGGSVDAFNGRPASSGTYPNWSFTQTGTAKTAQFRDFANYTIASGASITNARAIDGINVTINGTHDLNGKTATANYLVVSSTGTVKSTASGGHLRLNVITNSLADVIVSIQGTLIPNSWKISGGGRNQKYITRLQTTSGLELPNFEFGATSTAGGDNWRLQIENDVVFAQDFLFFSDGSGTPGSINNSTYNPNITFKGDVTFRVPNGMNYNVGTGTITLHGSSAQSVDFSGQTVEAIVVSDNSANAITLASNFTTPYVHDCANLIDENGYTVTTTGSDPSPCSTGSRYWVGLVDSDYENSGNWSTSSGGLGNASVPVGTNDVVFDSGSSVNCTMSANRAAASFDVQSGYSGVFSDANFSVLVSGNVTLSGANSSYGTSTWTVGGNWDFNGGSLSGTNVTFNSGSSTFESHSRLYGTITVNSGVTLTTQNLGGSVRCETLAVNGTYTSSQRLRVKGFVNTGPGGEITGTGEISFEGAISSPWGIGTHEGLISISDLVFHLTGTYPVAHVSGSISSSVLAQYTGSQTVYFRPTANVTFSGDFTLSKINQSGTAFFDSATNNPSMTFGGDVALSQTTGTITWSAGDGTIIFDNSGSQSVNFNGQTVEGIHVTDASTGSIVLASNFSTAWLRDCDSLIDLNGYTITNADSVDRCVYPYDPPTTIALDSAAAINVDQQLWLPMLEVSGTTTSDLSGNSNDGTLDAALSSMVTTLGGAISFPADGGIDSGATISSQPITVSVWFYLTTLPTISGHSLKAVFNGQGSSSTPTIYCYNPTGSKPIMRMYAGSAYLEGVTQINANEWTNVVGVFDGANSELYVGGALEASGNVGTSGFSSGLRLGESWNGSYDFPGRMQNARVWSRALSSSEVSSLHSDPWIGSDYKAVVPPSNRFFSPAAFARLG